MGTAASADDLVYGAHHTRLVDGKGIDGFSTWVPSNNGPDTPGTVCAQVPGAEETVRWLSLEIEVPLIVTKVQLSKRMGCCRDQGQYVTITIGTTREYDPNDDLCLPQISELRDKSGLEDYLCTANPKEGKFVKISKVGTNSLVICEAKVFGFPAGKHK